MPDIIKILPENVANKIAAGEVVQRPESVVKELMENALDSGADSIEVYIKNAGKSLIQINDNGCGMSSHDAELSVQRHATSKIKDFNDLEKLNTFGFRGEALSSIAAVSILEIRTERNEDEIGISIRVEEEGTIVKDKGSYPKGTSVIVRNLFYNTPARRNFLKTNATELKHIIDTFKKIALGNPDRNFKFYNDDEEVFNYQKGNIDNRLQEVIADNILDAVIPLKELTDYININGYIAKPTYLRKSKGEQYLFINRRFVSNKTVSHAVFSAYENILEKGDFPFYCLYLTLDPQKVDINVHPQKLEVKFEEDRDVYAFVKAVVKKGLGSYDLVPSVSFGDNDERTEKLRYDNYKRNGENDFTDRPDFKRNTPPPPRRNQGVYSDEEIDQLFNNINRDIKSNTHDEFNDPFSIPQPVEVEHSLNRQEDEAAKPKSTFIVLLHNKYILSQIRSGLMIIDAHVAHERILYEQALKSFEQDLPFSQQLLFPQELTVDPADISLINELNPYLKKLGFEIKLKGKNKLVLSGVSPELKSGSEVKVFLEILDEYKKNQQEAKLKDVDNLAASFSCKAAIKAGDRLEEQEMRQLVDQLFATSMPYVCPHGRPIIIKIGLEEFDKRFGRT